MIIGSCLGIVLFRRFVGVDQSFSEIIEEVYLSNCGGRLVERLNLYLRLFCKH